MVIWCIPYIYDPKTLAFGSLQCICPSPLARSICTANFLWLWFVSYIRRIHHTHFTTHCTHKCHDPPATPPHTSLLMQLQVTEHLPHAHLTTHRSEHVSLVSRGKWHTKMSYGKVRRYSPIQFKMASTHVQQHTYCKSSQDGDAHPNHCCSVQTTQQRRTSHTTLYH